MFSIDVFDRLTFLTIFTTVFDRSMIVHDLKMALKCSKTVRKWSEIFKNIHANVQMARNGNVERSETFAKSRSRYIHVHASKSN